GGRAGGVSHKPTLTWLSRNTGQAARNDCGGSARGADMRNVTTIRAAPATAAAPNAAPVPTWLATAPTSGPNSAPTTAAPRLMPSSPPRPSARTALAHHAQP